MNSAKTILLADDDALLIDLYRTKLEKAAFRVVVARDGEEALMQAQTTHPDLILLDVFMPKVTGVGVLQRLKSDPYTQKIPVVILTNLAGNEANIETAKRLGAVDYLIKDETDPQALIEKIQAVLSVSP